MDERVKNHVAAGFAADLYETVKAARTLKGETAFRHTMWEGPDGVMVLCALYPKADVLAFPGVDKAFAERLSTFNAVGVIADQAGHIEYYHLGGSAKPFTSLGSAQDLAELLDPDASAAFLLAYFQARKLDADLGIDLETVDFDTFVQKVESMVLEDTPLSALAKAAENLRN